MRLFIKRIVASRRLVPVFLSGSFIRSNATLEADEFSSFSSTRCAGLRLKNAFSELEKRADNPRNKNIIMNPTTPVIITEDADTSRRI